MPFPEAGPQGIGIRGAGQLPTYGIGVVLPDIPLWVPEQARAALLELTRQTMHLALQYAAGHISDEAPVGVSGALAQSFGADPATTTGGIELTGATPTGLQGRVFSSLPYAIVVDQGRRAGSPVSREGVEAIGLWAQRKLGLTADQADQAKWAIARAIWQYGTEGDEYFDRGVKASEPQIQALFAQLAADIQVELTRPRGGR